MFGTSGVRLTFVVEHRGLAAAILAAQGGVGIAVRTRVKNGSWDTQYRTSPPPQPVLMESLASRRTTSLSADTAERTKEERKQGDVVNLSMLLLIKVTLSIHLLNQVDKWSLL